MHDDAIRCVEFCPELGIVITGSWDHTLKLWDPRQHHSVGTYDQSGKATLVQAIQNDTWPLFLLPLISMPRGEGQGEVVLLHTAMSLSKWAMSIILLGTHTAVSGMIG